MKTLLPIALMCLACSHNISQAEPLQLPKGTSFSVTCGKVTLKFDARKFWNINRIDYQGTPLCVDLSGAHFGTVACFQDQKGFVGSGHVETGFQEEIRDYIIRLDGKAIAPEKLADGASLKGSHLVIEKISTLKNIRVLTRIALQDNILKEFTEVSVTQDTPVHLLYFFMHPWLPTFDKCFTPETGELTLKTSDDFPVFHPAKDLWLHHPSLKMGVHSHVTELPEDARITRMLWDRTVYRKDYLRDCLDATLPAGSVRRYAMTTEFKSDITPEQWRAWIGL